LMESWRQDLWDRGPELCAAGCERRRKWSQNRIVRQV